MQGSDSSRASFVSKCAVPGTLPFLKAGSLFFFGGDGCHSFFRVMAAFFFIRVQAIVFFPSAGHCFFKVQIRLFTAQVRFFRVQVPVQAACCFRSAVRCFVRAQAAVFFKEEYLARRIYLQKES